ncbi:MAG: ATP-dependent Clp protease proteolytic subunit [Candidatus Obscuribacterales bacterium]|jgi:ATP-dependent protease ClpP protease subunit
MDTPTFVLHRQAFVFNGSMSKNMGSFLDLITEFLELNAGNNRPLLLRLTSSGGVPEQIFGLCGLLRQVRAEGHEVQVHVLGQLCNFTYAVAAEADRIMIEPTASFVFGQPTVSTSGSIRVMESYLRHQEALFAKLVTAICERSNGKLNAATVMGWKAKHITAQEALELGLVDEVLPVLTEPVAKANLPEQSMRFNGSFSNDVEVFNEQIWLNSWLEDTKNKDRPLRLYLTSWGGTVVQALSMYGLLCEAQRQGHHLTIHVVGEAYSCALWFPMCAFGSGTVLIDSMATLMFHQPASDLSGDLDSVRIQLEVDKGVYNQTRALLQMAPGLTAERLEEWGNEPDRYLSAQEAADYGVGKLVYGLARKAKIELGVAPKAAS